MSSRVGLLLLPGFSLLAMSAVSSVLHAANDHAGESLYELHCYGLGSEEVPSQCGCRIKTQAMVNPDDLLLILCEEPLSRSPQDDAQQALRRYLSQRPSAALGGIGAGAMVLADMGLLEGYRAVIAWSHLAEATRRYPNLVFGTHLYELDRERLTCGGGMAAVDMMLAWLCKHHSEAFVAEVGALLGVERQRQGNDRQPLPSSAQPVVASARINEAIALMEANLGEPLQTEDIARLVGVSRRQLERLFRAHLDTLPSKHYLELRLKAARRQLRQSAQSILQIGLACGFASGPHFSTAYRSYFGHTPREERARRQMPQADNLPAAKDDNHD